MTGPGENGRVSFWGLVTKRPWEEARGEGGGYGDDKGYVSLISIVASARATRKTVPCPPSLASSVDDTLTNNDGTGVVKSAPHPTSSGKCDFLDSH